MAKTDFTSSQNEIGKSDYNNFALDLSNRLYCIKSMIAGARSLNQENDIDLEYLLNQAFDELKKMAEEVTETEGKYQLLVKGV